jgi:hypothetical protein
VTKSEEAEEYCIMGSFTKLYSSRNNVRGMKSRSMRWMGHVPRMGKDEMHTELSSETTKGRGHLEELGIDGRTVSECILEGVDWMHLAQDMGPVAGSCKHENESSGSVKGGDGPQLFALCVIRS